MGCMLSTPYLNAIVISSDGREHLMVRAVLSINRVHYVAFIPLVTESDINEVLEEEDWVDSEWVEAPDWDDEEDDGFTPDMNELDIEPAGFGRLHYDYATSRAVIEPLCWEDHAEIVDRIMTTLSNFQR